MLASSVRFSRYRISLGIGFRSLVHSDILSERGATLAIIMIASPMGIDGTLQQTQEGPAPARRCG